MRLRGHAGWLVLVTVIACSVYDETLFTVSNGAGGSGGGGSGSGNAGAGSSSGAGSASGGSSGGGSGGSAASVSMPGGNGGSAEGGDGGAPFVPVYELIDDMEDADNIVADFGDRDGRWVHDNDTSGNSTPDNGDFLGLIVELTGVDARDGSTHGVNLRAEGFQNGDWGAFVGVHFKAPDSTPYDASAYCGIHFWAKRSADVQGLPDSIEIRVPDKYTIPDDGYCRDPIAAGGAGGAAPGLCYDHHARIVVLTDEWKEYTVYFDQLHQGSWPGYEPSPLGELDVTSVTSLEFFLNKPDVYDLWIDDVSFVMKSPTGDCP
jgi:hypothetical protein